MNKLIVLFVLCILPGSAFCQGKIDYGNNKNAGKYYKVRGINIYTEQYGSGKPLLMIHGVIKVANLRKVGNLLKSVSQPGLPH